MRTLSSIPNQRVSLAEKEKNDYQLMKDTMNYFINSFYSQSMYYDKDSSSYQDRDQQRKISNYMLFNNEINQEDFIREINTHGFSADYFKEKKIQPYNKAANKIQVLLGEELMRPKKFRSVILNKDGLNEKAIQMEMNIRDHIDSFYNEVRNLIAQGLQQPEGQPTPEQAKELEDKINQTLETYLSTKKLNNIKNKSIISQIEFKAQMFATGLSRTLSLWDKANDAYKHALIGGEEIVWVGIVRNKLVVDVVNTIGFIHDRNENVKNIEDKMWAGRRGMISKAEALAKWSDYLPKKTIKE